MQTALGCTEARSTQQSIKAEGCGKQLLKLHGS